MKKTLSNYFIHIAIDLIALIVLMLSFYNNPYRLSNEKNFMKISHFKLTYLIYFIIIVLQVLVVYCKSFTYLNHTKFYSITLPILLIFIPFAGFLSIMLISNKVFVYRINPTGDKDYTEETKIIEKEESLDVSADSYKDNNTFSSPPNYFLQKK